MDLILIYLKTGYDSKGAIAPPFSVLTAAAPLNKLGYKIKIIDQRIDNDWQNTLQKALNTNPIAIGISSMTGVQLGNAIECAKFIKSISDIPIIWGGVHVSLLPYQSIKERYVDFVIVGEGEETLKDLVIALEKEKELREVKGILFEKDGKIIKTQEREFIDMETLDPTPWELVNVDDYILNGIVLKDCKRELDIGETSRGCPFGCHFCYSSVFHKRKWRPMSVEKTFEKIKNDVERFNLDGVWIRDDNYFVDLNRVKEVCNLMLKESLDIKWYSSGMRIDIFNRIDDNLLNLLKKTNCESFRFGVESGSNRVLKLINKNITKEDVYRANKRAMEFGISPYYSFMIGFPTETKQEIFETVDMMQQLKEQNSNAKMHVVNIYTPYPGTELFEVALKQGLKVPTKMDGWKDFHHLEVHTPNISKKQRRLIQNINEISYYTVEVVQENLPSLTRFFFSPIGTWLKWRWTNKKFGFAPELDIIRKARKIVFGA